MAVRDLVTSAKNCLVLSPRAMRHEYAYEILFGFETSSVVIGDTNHYICLFSF